MIRISSSSAGARRATGRSGGLAGGDVGADHRIDGSRTVATSARRSGGRGAGGPGGRGPGGRDGRGGSGCASRLNSEVSAQIARNVNGTMNWNRLSIRMPPSAPDQPVLTSRRELPVPAIEALISVSAWMFRRW